MTRKTWRSLYLALLAMVVVAESGCSTNPATGESSFTRLLSESGEQEIGRENHPKILAEFGGAYQHQDVPFEKILEELQPERSLSYSPLFQVYFNMLNLPDVSVELPDLSIEKMAAPEAGSKFDFTLYIKDDPKGILLTLVYNTDLFKQPRMAALLDQFEHLLRQIADRPAAQISTLSLVTPETQNLLPDPTRDLGSYWSGAISTLIARQAEKQPKSVAVVDYHEEWTYRELDEHSNRLANYLLAKGIAREGVVAVYGHRSAANAIADAVFFGLLRPDFIQKYKPVY
jgi:non-ribosomal peptide synthetase component F